MVRIMAPLPTTRSKPSSPIHQVDPSPIGMDRFTLYVPIPLELIKPLIRKTMGFVTAKLTVPETLVRGTFAKLPRHANCQSAF